MTLIPISILIIDDHPLIRTATTLALKSCGHFDIVGQAADGTTGIQMARALRPDVVLTDINMHPLDGIQTTRLLLANDPSLMVIGFSALPHEHQAKEMLDAGALGVIRKESNRNELCQHIIDLYHRHLAIQAKSAK